MLLLFIDPGLSLYHKVYELWNILKWNDRICLINCFYYAPKYLYLYHYVKSLEGFLFQSTKVVCGGSSVSLSTSGLDLQQPGNNFILCWLDQFFGKLLCLLFITKYYKIFVSGIYSYPKNVGNARNIDTSLIGVSVFL